MSKTITRRDLLKFTGGGILGLMFSPLPWKLLDDSAIWTQNWGLTPKLSHGPITTVFSRCPLCPAGCAVKAQCVSGMPYALSGVSTEAGTPGSLCPRGLAAHHMPYHPLRIVHPHRFNGKGNDAHLSAVAYDDAVASIAEHLRSTNGTTAMFDRRPGRPESELYARFANATGRGMVVASPNGETNTLHALQDMLGTPAALAFDIPNTSLIVSFGAPVLDGWGTPAMMTALKSSGSVQFIQIEPRYSRTARQADQWLPIAPGTERITALSMIAVLLEERLVPVSVLSSLRDLPALRRATTGFAPESIAKVIGIDPETLRKIVRTIAQARSAIVIAGSDPGGGPMDAATERTIAALNILCGFVGTSGGIIVQHPMPYAQRRTEATTLTAVPDHSITTLFIDGEDSGYALPWQALERKLSNDAMIVSFSPILDPLTVHADILLPSAAPFETRSVLTGGYDRSVGTVALSAPIVPLNPNTVTVSSVLKDLLNRLTVVSDIPTEEELQRAYVSALYAQRRGTVYSPADGSRTEMADLSSEEDLWTALNAGAAWSDVPMTQPRKLTFTLGLTAGTIPSPESTPLRLLATGWKGAVSSSQISPLLSKVFQESDLRYTNGIVAVNPVTAKALGVSKERPATISTVRGSASVRIILDPSVPPGIAEAAIGPAINGTETPSHPSASSLLDLCNVTAEGTWNLTPAQFLKA